MHNTIFYIIIAILLFDYLFERLIDYLNTTRWSNDVPEALKDLYDSDKYKKSQMYHKTNHRFGMLTSTFSMVLIVLMILLGGFALVNGWVNEWFSNSILVALVFFGILGFASDVLNTPFSIYDTFVIEEKFGFNKTTPKTFVLDKIKGWLVAAILGGGIMALIIWIYQLNEQYFWLYAWGVITFFSLFMLLFYSNLIVPLFNKQKPLEEGELKNKINDFAQKAGFKLKNIYVIDGSKRSTKANAYFTGFGPKKRIVLYDTLIEDLEVEEIVAVLAHEVGHYKKKHVVSGMITSIINTGVMLYVFGLLVKNPALSNALGVEEPSFHIGMIAFGILYSPLSFILGIGMNMWSRANEYQADAFAAKYGLAKELGEALKKLSIKSLSNLKPHPAYVFFHYSHPTLLQRLEKLNLVEK